MPGPHTVREHEEFELGGSLTQEDLRDLEAIQRNSASSSEDGTARLVFKYKRGGKLAAGNVVGVITTKRGTMVEILPKIDLGDQQDTNDEITKRQFLKMLRRYRGLNKALQLPESSIGWMRQFPMLEVFIRLFLENLNRLVRGGLARRYLPVEENLPHLRGRLLFREQIRYNLTNETRFFVAHDELSVNRPANRLISTALTRLGGVIRSSKNRQLLRELTAAFADVPRTADLYADWREHRVDRSMRHYAPVMQWVELFLFNRGLATFSGDHVNLSILFPMERVFEDFVAHSFRRYQDQYDVDAQGPITFLATYKDRDAFMMKPDISLRSGNEVAFILDAKWKRINAPTTDGKHNIDRADRYQLYAYGKRYGCNTVALVYPKNESFSRPLRYNFFDGLSLVCLPFDVTDPARSVKESLDELASCRA